MHQIETVAEIWCFSLIFHLTHHPPMYSKSRPIIFPLHFLGTPCAIALVIRVIASSSDPQISSRYQSLLRIKSPSPDSQFHCNTLSDIPSILHQPRLVPPKHYIQIYGSANLYNADQMNHTLVKKAPKRLHASIGSVLRFFFTSYFVRLCKSIYLRLRRPSRSLSAVRRTKKDTRTGTWELIKNGLHFEEACAAVEPPKKPRPSSCAMRCRKTRTASRFCRYLRVEPRM